MLRVVALDIDSLLETMELITIYFMACKGKALLKSTVSVGHRTDYGKQ